ncbi:MAG: molybdenum cofactor guanylyltransferase [Lutispora sp.]|uniref:molybdenum cofactor guanylyltransferase n=1 Tax=Lutispora sp. TaxID=2828727 RepID=UPI00356AD59D
MNRCEFSESGDNMYSIDTAIVLAGGNSKRMGFDKQFIDIGSISITEHIIESLKELFPNVILVTNKPQAYCRKDIEIIEDIYKGFGPLGGIHAGLMKSQSQYNYILACDMPYINKDYIRYMIKRLEESKYTAEAVITKYGQWIEPFNAFYSKALIPRIEAGMLAEKKKISGLLRMAEVLYIEEEEARNFSPDWNMFMNINTEKDLMIYRAMKQEDMYGAYQASNINKI